MIENGVVGLVIGMAFGGLVGSLILLPFFSIFFKKITFNEMKWVCLFGLIAAALFGGVLGNIKTRENAGQPTLLLLVGYQSVITGLLTYYFLDWGRKSEEVVIG